VLVDPLDPTEIASALARALADDALRKRLVAAGRHQVERYTWPAMADGMAALYHEVAAAGRA
jgi:glycosyltransferase involved in cell wall biosynthesis